MLARIAPFFITGLTLAFPVAMLLNLLPCERCYQRRRRDNCSSHSSSYAFDVDPVTHAFKNRRILAYVDAGVPDGIQIDTQGNIYSACGDGVQVRHLFD